ncbi:MAG: hypothetical protein ACE5MH_08865 [Terriglobia bacterium]
MLRRRQIVIATFGDLSQGYALHAACERCHRIGPLDKATHLARFGPRCPLAEVRRRLRSTDCGSRKARLILARVGAFAPT